MLSLFDRAAAGILGGSSLKPEVFRGAFPCWERFFSLVGRGSSPLLEEIPLPCWKRFFFLIGRDSSPLLIGYRVMPGEKRGRRPAGGSVP
jgi:hypothetical protein